MVRRNPSLLALAALALIGGGAALVWRNVGGDSSGVAKNGAECRTDRDCQSGYCTPGFADQDGDQHGSPDKSVRLCVSESRSLPEGFVATGDDCCDQDASVFPGQAKMFDKPQTRCPDVKPFDYDCNGSVAHLYAEATALGRGGCSFEKCAGASVWALSQSGGVVPPCGKEGFVAGCTRVGDSCSARPVGRQVNACR